MYLSYVLLIMRGCIACRQLGISEVPVCRLEHLTEHQIQAFTICDNKLTENAQWDEHLLGTQLQELAEAELDFDIEITGFETAEIDLFIVNLDPSSETDADPADSLPSPSPAHVSQNGDLWLLGKHRVLCGNALSQADYESLLAGQLANLVFTDPPYNVPIAGHASGRGKHNHREFVMASGEMTREQFTAFLRGAVTQLVHYTSSSSLHYICCDWRHMGELLAAGQPIYSQLANVCVWVKDNGGLGSFYGSQHELVFVFQNGSTHSNNVQLGRFGRSRTNVWNYPGANSFSRATDEGDLLALHPTVKPVALVADAILDCSKRGDVVLDPFLGSGTTVIAAERTGRTCYGMDLDPGYVDTVIRRWQRFTGSPALHGATGQSFDVREKECLDVQQQ